MTIDTKATKRILIVDDQPRVLDTLREIVASFQHEYAYEIATAPAVADAFVLLQRERFDLILLGMGADGHTASLFPHTPALKVDDRIAVENEIAPLATTRLTLTAATINDARNVTFLVAGAEKAPALSAVLNGPYEPDLYPSQLIRPARGALLWMVDEAAAASLSVGDRSV